MKIAAILGVLGAFLLHAGFLLFGGLLFPEAKKDSGKPVQVDLLSAEDLKEEKPEEKRDKTDADELESEEEQPPDNTELLRSLEMPDVASAPALDQASLGAIEAALNGLSGGGGDFGQSIDFTSGGHIGGLGKGAVGDAALADVFSMSEIDQGPRAISQYSPPYPASLRGKKIEGVVTLTFTVSAEGKVSDPRVVKSTHPSFDKPAMDAVKKWKFEPGVRGGQRVDSRMRVDIRFQPS